ncbi:MAG: hypothetical protein R3C11_11970 [Planctomycetaceae bacterium]
MKRYFLIAAVVAGLFCVSNVDSAVAGGKHWGVDSKRTGMADTIITTTTTSTTTTTGAETNTTVVTPPTADTVTVATDMDTTKASRLTPPASPSVSTNNRTWQSL